MSNLLTKIKYRLKGVQWKWNDLSGKVLGRPIRLPNHGARILIYHAINQEGSLKFNTKFISKDELKEQLTWLKTNTHIISTEDFAKKQFKPGKFNIALSFDDGFANNHKYLLPLIEELQIPVTVYVTTIQQLKVNYLWTDALDIVRFDGPENITVRDTTYTKGRGSEYFSQQGKRLKDVLKYGDWSIKQEAMDQFSGLQESLNKTNDDYWRMMSRSELEELANNPLVTLGSHGQLHNCLDAITPEEAKRELEDSKAYLEELTNKPVNELAYPDGRFSSEVVDIALQLGFEHQFVVNYINGLQPDPRLTERLGINPYISWRNQVKCIEKGRY